MVTEANKHINLTAILDEKDFIDKHLIDALLCDLSTLPEGSRILDVGTGGGFPGIPLAICYPEHEFTLMDATAKKLRIVSDIAEKLGLKNVTCVSGRAEALAREAEYREAFDMVVSRGVAAYNILAELCLPFAVPGGYFVAWKGPRYQEELDASKNAVTLLNAEVTTTKKHLLLKTDQVHVIIYCRKKGQTPKKYPRHFGAIKKNPL